MLTCLLSFDSAAAYHAATAATQRTCILNRQPRLQSDIQAVLRWSSDALLEAVRDALQRGEGHAAVRGWRWGMA